MQAKEVPKYHTGPLRTLNTYAVFHHQPLTEQRRKFSGNVLIATELSETYIICISVRRRNRQHFIHNRHSVNVTTTGKVVTNIQQNDAQ